MIKKIAIPVIILFLMGAVTHIPHPFVVVLGNFFKGL